MTARDSVTIRIATAGIKQIDLLAEELSATRSDVVRAIISEALSSDHIKSRVRARLKDQV